MAQDCECIPIQYPVRPKVPRLISVPRVSIHFRYTAMKALVSTLPACPFLDSVSSLLQLPVVTLVLPCCHFPILLILSFIPWPLLLPGASFYVLSVSPLLDQSPGRTLTGLVLFLIHEYGVTRMKRVDGILSFSGELCGILHSCVSL